MALEWRESATIVSQSCMSERLMTLFHGGWNSVKLVDELGKIDYEVIEDLRPEDEGDTAPWARIRFNHPDTWRILYRSPGEIAGYWSY